MTSQLAALSQLEQMESMSSSFAKVLEAERFSQAAAMLGKQVVIRTADGEDFETGTVARVDMLEGLPYLVVHVRRQTTVEGKLTWVTQQRVVGFDEVLSIKQAPTAGAPVEQAAAPVASGQTGDINGDGTVGLADLMALTDNYGRTAGASGQTGDINVDGTVGLADLMALADNYGRTAGGSK